MATTNNRLSSAISGIQTNNKLINALRNEVEVNTMTLQSQENWLLSILLDEVAQHQIIRESYNNLYLGFATLLSGKLSPLVIPVSDLHTAISSIKNLVSLHRPMFHLIHTQPRYYYNHADFMLHRNNMQIIITVRFPLATHDQPLTLYKILSYPVPVNSSSQHATMLSNLPGYLAIPNNDHAFQSFASLPETSLYDCDNSHHYIHCHFNLPMTSLKNMDCPMALFLANTTLIHQLCNFHFTPNIIIPTIRQLNQSHFLLVNVSTVHIQCYMKETRQIGCHYCLLQLPCNCSIISKHSYFMERFTGCHAESHILTITHPVNLALLQKFFGQQVTNSITANSTFPSPLNI